MSDQAKWNKRALTKLASVFNTLNRADELGGDLRDELMTRYRNSERAQLLVARLQRLRGKTVEAPLTSTVQAAAVEVDPVAAAIIATPAGLADPGIAAQLYGRDSCPWSGRAIRLLEDRKVDYDYIDLDDPDNGPLETQLVADTQQNTVPYVFLRGTFIGGYNALAEVDRLGQLDVAIMSETELAAKPELTKFSIAPRPNTDESADAESGPRALVDQ